MSLTVSAKGYPLSYNCIDLKKNFVSKRFVKLYQSFTIVKDLRQEFRLLNVLDITLVII